MDADTTGWIDEAIRRCKKASDEGVVLLIQRDRQQGKDDIVCCSSGDADTIRAIGAVITEGYAAPEQESE